MAALAGQSSMLRLLVLLAVLGEVVAIFLIVGGAASALFVLVVDAHPGDALGCRAVRPGASVRTLWPPVAGSGVDVRVEELVSRCLDAVLEYYAQHVEKSPLPELARRVRDSPG